MQHIEYQRNDGLDRKLGLRGFGQKRELINDQLNPVDLGKHHLNHWLLVSRVLAHQLQITGDYGYRVAYFMGHTRRHLPGNRQLLRAGQPEQHIMQPPDNENDQTDEE
ncbi:hypothetical protein D3C87_1933410 [compost metagenome]